MIKFLSKFKFPFILQFLSIPVIIIGIGIWAYNFTIDVYYNTFISPGIDTGVLSIIAIMLIGFGLIYLLGNILEYFFSLIKYSIRRKRINYCPNCQTNMNETGFNRDRNDKSGLVKIQCLHCHHTFYRKGYF